MEAFAKSFKDAGDDYSYMIAQTLCDALAEALSTYAQRAVFSDSPKERAGVRAAAGYASYPDHSEKAKFEKLLLARRVGGHKTYGQLHDDAEVVCRGVVDCQSVGEIFFGRKSGRTKFATTPNAVVGQSKMSKNTCR